VARSRGDDLNQVAKECEALGVKALPILADVAKHEEVNRVVQQGMEKLAKWMCWCAQLPCDPQKLLGFSYEEWHEAFAVNLHSTFYLPRRLLRK